MPRAFVSPTATSSPLLGTGLLYAVAMTDRCSPSPASGGVTRARSRRTGRSVDIEVYAFLTTTPNKLVATVNHERMPVLLTREEEFDVWLKGAPHVAFALAQEYPPGQMRVQEGFKKQDLLDVAA